MDKWTDLQWERIGKPLSHDDDCLYDYVVRATDGLGIEYEGTGEYCCGELINVEDIEVISTINSAKIVKEIINLTNAICDDYARNHKIQ